jgi:hypothetical protein
MKMSRCVIPLWRCDSTLNGSLPSKKLIWSRPTKWHGDCNFVKWGVSLQVGAHCDQIVAFP